LERWRPRRAGVIAGPGRRSRAAAIAGGLLVSAGAAAERFAVFRAGTRSAERPEDTVGPQRARIERGETRGAACREPRATAYAPLDAGDAGPGERPVSLGSPAIPPR
jgi:hypothetical protein